MTKIVKDIYSDISIVLLGLKAALYFYDIPRFVLIWILISLMNLKRHSI